MNSYYKLENFNNEEKKIGIEILKILNKKKLPKCWRKDKDKIRSYHHVKTGFINQKEARSMIIGEIYFQGKLKTAYYTNKYLELYNKLKLLMKTHNPNYEFSSIYVNHNTKSKKHIDGRNMKISYIVGLGDYEGGECNLYINEKKHSLDIKECFLSFNSGKIIHSNEKFKGNRYTFVFFKHSTNKQT